MFCVKCGKEIPEDSKVCMYCGEKIKEGNNQPLHTENKKKKKRFLPVLLVAAIIVIMIGIFGGSDGSEEQSASDSEQKALTELQKFTNPYKDELNRYILLDKNEKWAVVYTEENEFVVFDNATVVECFTESLGENCFDEESLSSAGFTYDIDENEARIYLDAEIEEGKLSIVNYSFEDEEYILNVDGDKYETTDSFNELVESYDLVKNMQSDIDAFKEDLKENNLTIADLGKIEYETLDESFIPEEEK